MAFKRKKIGGQKTVGGRLAEARKRKKISLEQVEEATKIRSKYLEAIEADNWYEFPSRVYLLGFVRRYADFLGLDREEILEEFKLEFGQRNPRFSLHKSKRPPVYKLIVTPRLIIWILVAALAAGIVGYIVYSISKFSTPPVIEITSPKEEKSITREIVIQGKTQDTAIVEINGQPVNVDDKGNFSQKVELNAGVNFFEIKAKSRLGKESSEIRRVLYEPEAGPQVPALTTPTALPTVPQAN